MNTSNKRHGTKYKVQGCGCKMLLIVVLLPCLLQAQLPATAIRQFLDSRSAVALQYPNEVKEFYKIYQYNSAWINDSRQPQVLLRHLKAAASLGLNEKDYQFDFLQSYRSHLLSLRTGRDSLLAEIRFTDAAIHFYRDVVYGNHSPLIGYNGLQYAPECNNVPQLLAATLQRKGLDGLLTAIEPRSPGYMAVKGLFSNLYAVINAVDFKEVRVASGKISTANKALMQKLQQLCVIDTAKEQITDSVLQEKIRVAQRLFGLQEDGIAGYKTRLALNIPLTTRLKALQEALNSIRWLHCATQEGKTVVVNIPSATMLVYENGKIIMESKVITGKSTNRTPTLTSTITHAILYPYWYVPKKIATRELLPLIQRNISYLDANNMQVLDLQGRILKPSTINWHALSPDYFPYLLRQSTGCDNSLGIVKLDFYNPYSVYLHDTPWKKLFDSDRRFFSHGCIRVEKAATLARLLLADNTIAIDTLEEKGCLPDQPPVSVPASEKMKVFVLYNTAWFDGTGAVQLFEDIYRKF